MLVSREPFDDPFDPSEVVHFEVTGDMDAAIHAFTASLVRREMATRPARRGRTAAQRVKTAPFTTLRPCQQPPCSKVPHERVHFPF